MRLCLNVMGCGVLNMSEFRFIGKNLARQDAIDAATGKAVYCADRVIEGMLYAKTVRCNGVYGRLKSVDTTRASALDGVVFIATAEDIPGVKFHGISLIDQPVLVEVGGIFRLPGEPVAIVAAETERIAEQAVGMIEVEYEEFEPITDYLLACEPESPMIHNIRFPKEYDYAHGDVVKGFQEADIIFKYVQHVPGQEHAYLETEAALAYYDYEGVLTLVSQAHEPFGIRHQVARSLALSVGKVRSIVPTLGGSFGGKQNMTVHIHAALITYHTKRPVHMVWSREESFALSTKRHRGVFRYEIGAKKDGKLTAIKVDYTLDAGAYTEHSMGVTMCAGQSAIGPYYIPNVEVTGRSVFTNNPIAGAFRGYGGPQSVCGLERAMYKLAVELGVSPVDIRLKNMLRIGNKVGNREMVMNTDSNLQPTIESVLQMAENEKPQPSGSGKLVGRGLACALPQFDVSAKPYNGLTGAGAEVEVFFDGTLQVRTGLVEMGTGLRMALAQLAAETMGVDISNIEVILSDSALTPKAGPAVASRSLYCGGNAVVAAAKELKSRLMLHAAKMFASEENRISFDGKKFTEHKTHKELLLREVASNAFLTGVNLVGYAWIVGTEILLGHTHISTLADVEVDVITGEIELLLLATCHDSGKMINPLSVKGQLYGGAVMGQGWAINENLQVKGGRLVNRTLSEYLIPTSLDIAKTTKIGIIEDPYPDGPFGAKGVGEHSMYTIAPAIMNAIEDATGVSLRYFPATPETVWKEMRRQASENNREGM